MNIFENWQETKSALLEGLDKRKQALVAPVLEQQKKYMTEAVASGTAAGDIGNFQKIIIPMIRRIIPGTIASEIVGVQPMSGPVGLVYSLRFKFAESNVTAGITAADEAFGTNGKMKHYYSGGIAAPGADYYPGTPLPGAGDDGVDNVYGTSDDVLVGMAAPTGEHESFGGRKMSLEVLKQTVTAGTRRLQARWSVEAMQDISSQHGLDLESEIASALSAEIVHEMDVEIVSDLLALAGNSATFDMSGAFTGTPNYVGDRHAVLGVLINKVANDIARKTRRGAGNFVVVSPAVVSVLQSASKSVFAPAVSGSFEGPNNTKLVGVLNGTIKVYSFLFNDLSGIGDNVLVGYKGGNGETDVGYFYCPYIPLMTSNVVTDPTTYNQQVMLMTRYGKATFNSTATSLGNSADYYGKITVSNLAFV
jgi:hypothetical protein